MRDKMRTSISFLFLLASFWMAIGAHIKDSSEEDLGEESPPKFEAAFQGKCGPNSPCLQICVELHDGTFECQCRIGYELALDGYSCSELSNNTSESGDFDSWEDDEDDQEVEWVKKQRKQQEREAGASPPHFVNTLDDELNQIRKINRFSDPEEESFDFLSVDEGEDRNEGSEIDDDPEYGKVEAKSPFPPPPPPAPEDLLPQTTARPTIFDGSKAEEEEDGAELYDDDDDDEEFEVLTDEEEDLRPLKEKIKSGLESTNNIFGGITIDVQVDVAPPPPISTYIFTPSEEKPSTTSDPNLGLVEEVDDKYETATSTLPPEECPLKCVRGVCFKELPQNPEEDPNLASDGTSTYRCLCPMGFGGNLCDREDLGSYTSGLFRGQSWVAFPVLHDAYMSDQISLEFRPETSNGILLLTGERDDLSGDFLALFLRDGFLEFRFDCGSGPGSVRSSTPVLIGKWNKVNILRRRWDGFLQLNDGPYNQGKSAGLFSRITFRQPLIIGGTGNITLSGFAGGQTESETESPPEIPTPTSLPFDAPPPASVSTLEESTIDILRRIGGFRGCLRELVINDKAYKFGIEGAESDAIQGFDIEQCSDQNICDFMKCHHGGQCVVQKEEAFGCFCPLGYSGKYCETPLDLQIPSFNGSSYLKYEGLGSRVLTWLELELVLKIDAMDGLILYNGFSIDGTNDFISLIVDQGHLEFQIDLGTGSGFLRSETPIALGEWHRVVVSRSSRLISMKIDNQSTQESLIPGPFTQLTLPHNLFLGGIPDPEWLSPKVKTHVGFSGCIQKLVVNEKPLRIMGSALSGVNLENCIHPCLNNPCENKGECIAELDDFKCFCPLGWRGSNCRTRMDKDDALSSPRFTGDSYLRYTEPKIIRRISGTTLNLSFRVKTSLSSGVIIWAGRKTTSSTSDFLTIGLRNGFISASFSLGSGQVTIIYNTTQINDGEWHRVQLIRNEQEARLIIDNGAPISGVAPGKLRQLNINNGLYIGGLNDPKHQSMNKYSDGFVGCLSELSLGNDFRVSLIQNASEGRNVEYCD